MTGQTKTKTKTIEINLIDISKQIALTATKLHEKVKTTGEAIVIPASALIKKYPDLKSLKDENIFKVRENMIGGIAVDTLCLFRDPSDGAVKLYDTELNPVTVQYTISRYDVGIGGYAVATVDGAEITVTLSTDSDYLDVLMGQNKRSQTGEGMPDPEMVKTVPCPICPVHSLEIGMTYTLKRDDGKSVEYDSQMLTIESETGKQFHRVTCNSELSRIYAKHGIGAKFKIVSITERKNKDGETFDSTTGKTLKDWEKLTATGKISSQFKPQMKVTILDLQGEDFSDFDL